MHALRNALIPVITVIGLQVGLLLSGAILTETIFSWPGVGNWLIHGVQSRDYPVVQGGILLIATIVISGQPDRRPALRRHQSADPACADGRASQRACRDADARTRRRSAGANSGTRMRKAAAR